MSLDLLNSLPMSTFVLVHGAWQSSGTWDLLAPLLEKRGHRVIAPVLAGLGTDQSRLSRDTTLKQHVEDVSVAVSKCPDPVILVGHSYAGMIISGVAGTNPTQIRDWFSWTRSFRKTGKAHWTCFPLRLALTFAAWRETMETAGGYRAERANLTSGDLSWARHVSLCVRGCAISVCVALRSASIFPLIGKAAFQLPSLPVSRKDIPRGRSSLHSQQKLGLRAGRSRN